MRKKIEKGCPDCMKYLQEFREGTALSIHIEGFRLLFFSLSLIILLFLFIFSCERVNEEPPIPVLFTGEVFEISDTGAVFTGIFRNIEPDRVTDYGFLWGLNENPTFENSLKYSLPLPFVTDYHSYRNNSSLMRDKNYYVRIFVTYDDETYYGKAVSFFSLGSRTPKIHDVIPDRACFGDTVQILGSYFGLDPAANEVYFGEDRALVLDASDTSIVVRVPFFKSTNSYFTSDRVIINVKRTGYGTVSTNLFDLSPPRISSYTPDDGTSTADLTILGSGFYPGFTDVFIGDHLCEIVEMDLNQIQAHLPPLFQAYEGSLKVTVANRTSILGVVKIRAPEITRISPDTAFSFEEVKLYGTNLGIIGLHIQINDMLASILEVTDDSLTVEVPGGICNDELTIRMLLTFRTELQPDLHIESISFRQPRNLDIETAENQYFDGRVIIRGDYLPEVIPQSVEMNGMGANYSYSFDRSGSSIFIDVPANVQPVNEWLNANIDFCPSTQLSFDSVFHIPPPVILDAGDTIYSLSSPGITGANFNNHAQQNQVYLGENLVFAGEAPQANYLQYSIDNVLATGIYPLKVVTNGQESNSVDVELVERWKKLSDLPQAMYHHPFFFLYNNMLYMGGGDHNPSNAFYSYDLISGQWNTRSPLPIQSGLSFSVQDYGYAYGEGKLFRYDFAADSWSLVSEKEINYSSGFYYDNKIFILPIGIDETFHYYDLAVNAWVEFSGYPGWEPLNTNIQCVLSGGKAYLFHDGDIYVMDLSDYSITDTGAGVYSDYRRSNMGFEYNSEAYFYLVNHFEIYDPQDFSYRIIGGPTGHIVKLIQDGNIVYLINDNELWTFDLNLQ